MSLAIPSYWREFREQFQLLHTEVEIPEEYDLSGVGADIEFYDDDTIVDSMTDSYPECIVNKDGFLPVGGCQTGSGDPYFINTSEGVGGKLYQIYHDMVFDETYSRAEAIATVLNDYRHITRFFS